MLLGVMDDALLGNVPDVAFADLEKLRPQVIRYDLSWAHTAPRKPAVATDPNDPAYDWARTDQVVLRADALGIPVLLTIEVTPKWAGGGTGNKPPVNMATLQAFSYAAATRYSGQHIVPSTGQVLPAVTRWEAWNEPNTTSHLKPQYSCRCPSAVPVSPKIYAKILKAIYLGVHAAGKRAGVIETVAGGATKPNYSGPKTYEPAVAPLRFMKELASATRRSTSTPTIRTARTPARRRARSRTRTTSRSRSPAPDQGPRQGVPEEAPEPLDHRVRAADEAAGHLPGRQPLRPVPAAAAQRRRRRARIRASTCWCGS